MSPHGEKVPTPLTGYTSTMNHAALVASAIFAAAIVLPACPPPMAPKDPASLVNAAKSRPGARGILLSFSQTTDALSLACVTASRVVEATDSRAAAFDLVVQCEKGVQLVTAAILPAAKAVDAAGDNDSTLAIVACAAQALLQADGLITKVIQLVTPKPPSALIDGLGIAHTLADYASTCDKDGGK